MFTNTHLKETQNKIQKCITLDQKIDSLNINLGYYNLVSDKVYFILDVNDATVKIGVSKFPKRRMAQIGCTEHRELEMLFYTPTVGYGCEGYTAEKHLHEMFDGFRVGNTEWFMRAAEVDSTIALFALWVGGKDLQARVLLKLLTADRYITFTIPPDHNGDYIPIPAISFSDAVDRVAAFHTSGDDCPFVCLSCEDFPHT